MLIKLFTFCFPWYIRRYLLKYFFGYKIHPTARIGLSWVFPDMLIMEANSRIDHFTVAIHLDLIKMNQNSKIGRSNWITGMSTKKTSLHFQHQKDRCAELHLDNSVAITKNHHLDCTNKITIGCFSTIAGYHSQLLTHSIDILEGRQHSAPIHIGAYSFISTNVVILGGANLPSFSVLGAKALLNKSFTQEWTLYGGVPAKPISSVNKDAKYFSRVEGFVI